MLRKILSKTKTRTHRLWLWSGVLVIRSNHSTGLSNFQIYPVYRSLRDNQRPKIINSASNSSKSISLQRLSGLWFLVQATNQTSSLFQFNLSALGVIIHFYHDFLFVYFSSLVVFPCFGRHSKTLFKRRDRLRRIFDFRSVGITLPNWSVLISVFWEFFSDSQLIKLQ